MGLEQEGARHATGLSYGRGDMGKVLGVGGGNDD